MRYLATRQSDVLYRSQGFTNQSGNTFSGTAGREEFRGTEEMIEKLIDTCHPARVRLKSIHASES
jgi:hypothetical protein